MTDVFISYASEDRTRARMLADALEARGLSVWWDRKIDPGRTYALVIEDQLDRAKSVVVLWSKHSVVSEWVKNEAAVALERDKLVPALIDAVKLPLEFRHKQTVDLIGWEGNPGHVEFDALCRGISVHVVRESTPQPPTPPPGEVTERNGSLSRARVPVSFWAVVALIILAGVGLWYWDAFHRQHIEYFANVIKRWGLPEGVGRLTDEQVRHRNVTLAFVKRGRWGVVQEVRAANSRGAYPPIFAYFPPLSLVGLNPLAEGISDLLGICRVTFTRDANGQILKQSAYNRSDRLLYTLHYAQPDIAEYKEGAFSKEVRESGITHIKYIRSESGPEAGLDKELLYLDRTGTLKPDHAGSHGLRCTFNALGVPVEFTNLGTDGQPAVDRVGRARITRTNDGQGNLTQEVNLGPHNQPVLDSTGSSEMKMRYDQHGNVTELAFFGTDGQLVTSKELGAAGRTFAYDDHGNIVENTFFGPDRQLVVGVAGFAKQTVVWDEKGRSLETYFGPDGKPMLISGRTVKTRAVWDERGYLVEGASFDEHDRPVRGDDGCAKKSFTYDKDGNQTETACFDEGGEPVRATDGAAQAKSIYDERGNRVEERYFGPDGQSGRYEEDYVKTRWKRNEQGKLVEEAYFDAADKPVRNKNGYAKVTNSYDLQGKVIEVLFFDEKGQPIARKGGYARLVWAYDERGNKIEETLFDAQGKPSRGEDGYFKSKHAYDERGYQIEAAYYDERERPTVLKDGYAKKRNKYNDRGQLIETEFLGLDGSPVVLNKYGFAKRRWTYDARGKVSQLAHFDRNDHLVRHANGYATMRYAYDDLGRETKREFYDVGGARVFKRVTIDKVETGSKSHRVGLQVGDALLSYDGEEVANKHVFSELELVKGERPRELTVQRDGKVLSLHVAAGRLTGIETVDKVPADLGKASEPARSP